MKTLILYTFLLIPQLIFSQIEIPTKISVKLYSGGDYRGLNNEKGSYSDIDSISYSLIPELKIFHSGKIYQQRKIFMRDEDFNEYNINEDSTMTVYDEASFTFEEMKELLYWLDEDNYSTTIFRDTFTFGVDTDKFETTDTFLISPTISIVDYGVDTSKFQKECGYYGLILEGEKNCDKIDYDSFLNSLLREDRGHYSVSSYLTYVQFRLTFNEYQLIIWQRYSGDMNIEWWIDKENEWWIDENEERMEVLSPHLNSILVKLLPYNRRKSWGLEDYRDKENLFKKYFSTSN